MALTSDFINCIPKHLREDLYFQLKNWYESKDRESYIEQNKEQHRQNEVQRARQRAIERKQAIRPQKV